MHPSYSRGPNYLGRTTSWWRSWKDVWRTTRSIPGLSIPVKQVKSMVTSTMKPPSTRGKPNSFMVISSLGIASFCVVQYYRRNLSSRFPTWIGTTTALLTPLITLLTIRPSCTYKGQGMKSCVVPLPWLSRNGHIFGITTFPKLDRIVR